RTASASKAFSAATCSWTRASRRARRSSGVRLTTTPSGSALRDGDSAAGSDRRVNQALATGQGSRSDHLVDTECDQALLEVEVVTPRGDLAVLRLDDPGHRQLTDAVTHPQGVDPLGEDDVARGGDLEDPDVGRPQAVEFHALPHDRVDAVHRVERDHVEDRV